MSARIEPQMPLGNIVEGTRARKTYRRIEQLAASIEAVGLLQPIVVRADKTLVCGGRRLRACAHLGWTTAPVRIAMSIKDELTALRAEQDENAEREDLAPSEKYALYEQIKVLEDEAAAERRREGGRQGGSATATEDSGAGADAPKLPGKTGRAADKAAAAAGLGSRKTAEKVGRVIEAAEEDPETFGPVLEQLDAGTLSINAAEKQLARAAAGVGKDDLGTPRWPLDCIRLAEGRGFDLDATTNEHAIRRGFVGATTNWTKDDDCFAQETYDVVGEGKTWLWHQPPYSGPMAFTERVCTEWDAKHLERVWSLVKLDTSSENWAELRRRAAFIVLPRKRLAHMVGDQEERGSNMCSGMLCLARGSLADLAALYDELRIAFVGRADVYPTEWVAWYTLFADQQEDDQLQQRHRDLVEALVRAGSPPGEPKNSGKVSAAFHALCIEQDRTVARMKALGIEPITPEPVETFTCKTCSQPIALSKRNKAMAHKGPDGERCRGSGKAPA